MLQAVHLLLALTCLPVSWRRSAMDPESLSESPGVITSTSARSPARDRGWTFSAASRRRPTIWKIFQIPLCSVRCRLNDGAACGDPPRTGLRRNPIEDRIRQAPAGSHRARTAGCNSTEAATGVEGADAEVHAPPVRISAGEIEFLQTHVARLFNGNARALKRFVNTYHLVKAALSEVEFDLYAEESPSDDAREDSYRVCMAQLALLATDRRRAQLLAKLIDEASHSSRLTLSAWLDDIEKREGEDVRSIAVDLRAVLLPPLEDLAFDRFVSGSKNSVVIRSISKGSTRPDLLDSRHPVRQLTD